VYPLAYFFNVELVSNTSMERRIMPPHITDDMVTTAAQAKHHIGVVTLNLGHRSLSRHHRSGLA
jgi:hypothetical protein